MEFWATIAENVL